jgi:hypothetical protein
LGKTKHGSWLTTVLARSRSKTELEFAKTFFPSIDFFRTKSFDLKW